MNFSASHEINIAIEKLQLIIKRQLSLSRVIAGSLMISIFSFCLIVILIQIFPSSAPWSILVVIPSLYGLIALYSFDVNRKRGMVLYDSITNALEWLIHNPEVWDREKEIKLNKYVEDVQKRLRTFSRTNDLPIAPGVSGQTIYLIAFIILPIAAALFIVK